MNKRELERAIGELTLALHQEKDAEKAQRLRDWIAELEEKLKTAAGGEP